MAEALLTVEDLRVDVDGVPACDGLAFSTSGERILALGAPRPLYEAIVGIRAIVRGAIQVCGRPPGAAVDAGLLAGAPLDPPLPMKWTPHTYIQWSARLAGHPRAEARRLTDAAIEKMQLGTMAKNPIASLVPHARRAVVLASALATNAEVIVLEDPLAGLAEEIARTWARIIVRALEDKRWITFAARISLTSPLALAADEALTLSSTRVFAQGAPAEIAAADKRYVARVHGRTEALEARIAERGGRLHVQGAQVVVDLGESLTTADLLGICADVDVTIVEMLPIARALG